MALHLLYVTIPLNILRCVQICGLISSSILRGHYRCNVYTNCMQGAQIKSFKQDISKRSFALRNFFNFNLTPGNNVLVGLYNLLYVGLTGRPASSWDLEIPWT